MGFEDATELRIAFNEPCELVAGSVIEGESLAGVQVDVRYVGTKSTDSDAASTSESADDAAEGARTHELSFVFSSAPDPGTEHALEAQVADKAGNHLRFVATFYGLNKAVPAMLINEFTTQGSGSHPDIVEIRILTNGNLAGSCIYEGVPGNWEQFFTFPDLNVEAGDFVVVHFKPQGIPEEINEVLRKDSSGGHDTSDGAWDFWVREGTGLSGNNGAITLCENPIGGIIDAVLYSNRTSTSDDRYRGFGSRAVAERADFLVTRDAWEADGQVRPEDAVNPDDSTATRSMARSTSGLDTNCRDDWHITPTRGLTPGAENTDEVYRPE
jgi:hypothetical protein